MSISCYSYENGFFPGFYVCFRLLGVPDLWEKKTSRFDIDFAKTIWTQKKTKMKIYEIDANET